jgi:methionyl-tRNA synthetase
MLKAADLPLPKAVWAHGFIGLGGERFSKSAGVTVALDDAINRYGSDAFRYFLLREVPWDGDGNFSWQRFDERYTSDLANDLGNLANRTLSMLHRYRGGTVPAGRDTDLQRSARDAVSSYRDRMDRYLLHEGAAAAFQLVADANSFIESKAPWKLAKNPDLAGELDDSLRALIAALGWIAAMLFPFLPERMTTLWSALGSGKPLPTLDSAEAFEPAGWTVSERAVLFPRPEIVETQPL